MREDVRNQMKLQQPLELRVLLPLKQLPSNVYE